MRLTHLDKFDRQILGILAVLRLCKHTNTCNNLYLIRETLALTHYKAHTHHEPSLLIGASLLATSESQL